MDIQQNNWDSYYKNNPAQNQDNWLADYSGYFEKKNCYTALDLGCGSGSNIPFLLGTGASVSACDYSQEAINIVRSTYDIEALVLDIRNGLPYADEQFDVVISDLSLHYFTSSITKRIIRDINRILRRDGVFLARVNSIHDRKHGFGEGEEIEKNLFLLDGRSKRFFDEDAIEKFFTEVFHMEGMKEKWTSKYSDEKVLWELALKKGANRIKT